MSVPPLPQYFFMRDAQAQGQTYLYLYFLRFIVYSEKYFPVFECSLSISADYFCNNKELTVKWI